MKLALVLFGTIILLCERFRAVFCSLGDRSVVYLNCLDKCMFSNCTHDGSFSIKAAIQQEFWCSVLGWSCRDECQYQCMWTIVQYFNSLGEHTPKFHGRWPFVRFLGMQEPASVFASVLNLLANAYMYKKIRRQFPLSKADLIPIVTFWHVFAVVCMNAWVWSTIFHMRDSPFTEFMDYACALSMVMGLFVAAVFRLLYKRTKTTMFVLVVPLFYFVTHVRYLYSGVINYDYNMKLNVFFGVAGSIIWIFVSWNQWLRGLRYSWRMLAFTVLSGAALSLELFDFPPRLAVLDAHALWHFCTAPLPLLFYKYVLDDLRYLQSKELEKFAFKLT